ncbi:MULTISPECIES: hypothetical protein [Brevundimonas]|uniref:Uncharacterized protein n=1 Tax=Brevundimonas nasdae TaxID=172043 RepID=A0ABX8TEN4_9CAUL|nr:MULTISPECIES: hypothetical protein [Brevundimonas]QYC09636.1 hypothetical protein KWG56_13735 [Brevundimonas nasdae]QYC15685.1 hypothetical protein KWG63_09060 [Brevundimonas nasdae]
MAADDATSACRSGAPDNRGEAAVTLAQAPVAGDASLASLPERPASPRFGAPLQAWYPVAREAEARRGVRTRLHGRMIVLRRNEAGAIVAPHQPHLLVVVRAGLVWARQDDGPGQVVPPLIEDPIGGGDLPMIACSEVEVETDYDQAVLGLVDPAHVPMVHDAWWWRASSKRRVKTKQYAPSPFGFTATAADAFASAPAYALTGASRRIAIEFRLPSTRIERVEAEGFRLVNLTTVTPTAPGSVTLRNTIYCSVTPMRALHPFLSALGRAFLEQDARILRRLESRPAPGHPLLFVGAPDQPSLWYYQCKAALSRATDDAPFANPVRATVLQWRT